MGAFSFAILESDNAMDWESDLLDIAGLDGYSEEPDTVRRALEAVLPQLLQKVAVYERDDPNDTRHHRAIGYQVLGVLLMDNACTLTEDARQQVIAGCMDCGEYIFASISKGEVRTRLEAKGEPEKVILEMLEAKDNDWTKGRLAAIDDLVEKLRAYDLAGGTAVRVKTADQLEADGALA